MPVLSSILDGEECSRLVSTEHCSFAPPVTCVSAPGFYHVSRGVTKAEPERHLTQGCYAKGGFFPPAPGGRSAPLTVSTKQNAKGLLTDLQQRCGQILDLWRFWKSQRRGPRQQSLHDMADTPIPSFVGAPKIAKQPLPLSPSSPGEPRSEVTLCYDVTAFLLLLRLPRLQSSPSSFSGRPWKRSHDDMNVTVLGARAVCHASVFICYHGVACNSAFPAYLNSPTLDTSYSAI